MKRKRKKTRSIVSYRAAYKSQVSVPLETWQKHQADIKRLRTELSLLSAHGAQCIAAEREACAQVADDRARAAHIEGHILAEAAFKEIAAAIRGRKDD